jgi:hypothetical protein
VPRWERPSPCRRPPYTNSPSRCVGDPPSRNESFRCAILSSGCRFILFLFGIPFSFGQDCNGKEVSLETYKGKALLVVNVASKWYHAAASSSITILACGMLKWSVFLMPCSGFTETNYTQLTELYQKYRDKGQAVFRSCCLFLNYEHL